MSHVAHQMVPSPCTGPGRPPPDTPAPFSPSVQPLECRKVPTLTALFSPVSGGILAVMGDGLENVIAAVRDSAGAITVNAGAVPIVGGTPTVAKHRTDPYLRPGRQRLPVPRPDQRAAPRRAPVRRGRRRCPGWRRGRRRPARRRRL